MKKSLIIGGVIASLLTSTLVITTATAKTTASTKKAGTVYFDSGRATLDKSDKAKINKWIPTLKSAKTITVYGYVQKSSNSANDKSLAKKRALAVKRYLVKRGVTVTIAVKAKGLPVRHKKSKSARRATITYTTSTSTTTTPANPKSHNLTFHSYMAAYQTTDCTNIIDNSFPYTASVINSDGTATQSFELDSANTSSVDFPYYGVQSVCSFTATFSDVTPGDYTFSLVGKAGQLSGRTTFWGDTVFLSQGPFEVPQINISSINTTELWDSVPYSRLGIGACYYQDYSASQTEIELGRFAHLTMPDHDSTGPKTLVTSGCD